MKFITCVLLQYEYTQVAVDLFCKNFTIVLCLMAVCFHVLPFFLHLKECFVILEFGSTVSCGLAREAGHIKHNIIA